jgi:hypothetical protein
VEKIVEKLVEVPVDRFVDAPAKSGAPAQIQYVDRRALLRFVRLRQSSRRDDRRCVRSRWAFQQCVRR